LERTKHRTGGISAGTARDGAAGVGGGARDKEAGDVGVEAHPARYHPAVDHELSAVARATDVVGVVAGDVYWRLGTHHQNVVRVEP
jgi:hypothetical protein